MRRIYESPILFLENGGDDHVIGQGSGQGSIPPEISYDEWWEDTAWGGTNPDADYNGDGVVDRADYEYYIAHELWKG